MAAMFPVSGAFSVFGSRFVSPAFGFTLGNVMLLGLEARAFDSLYTVGWNYWLQWFVTYWFTVLHATHVPSQEPVDT